MATFPASLPHPTKLFRIASPAQAFDNLLLLQRGGRTTYFGALGKESSQLVAYLEAAPGVNIV